MIVDSVDLQDVGLFVGGALAGWLIGGVVGEVAKARMQARLNRWLDEYGRSRKAKKAAKIRAAADAERHAVLERIRAERVGARFRRHPDPKNPEDSGRTGEVVDLGKPPEQNVRVQWTNDDGTPAWVTNIAWRALWKDAEEQRRISGWHEFEPLDT